MNMLEDIIQRCHKRHAEQGILRQRKTVVEPAPYKSYPYNIKVHCVRRNPITVDELEQADISIMPIGHAPKYDQGPQDFGGVRFTKRQRAEDWRLKLWYESWGIQIYTGIPSERDNARWHDFEFTYNAICNAPEAVSTCIEALLNTTSNPLLVLTKTGGLRFSCRIKDYLHPKNDEANFFIYKHTPTTENPDSRDIYLEIRGNEGYSQWDIRYEVLLGNLLDPPVLSKEMLFVNLNKLRKALHEPEPNQKTQQNDTQQNTTILISSLGSEKLDLAKKAFLKRGFSHDQEANGFYYWRRDDVVMILWEYNNTVWVRATTPNSEYPTNAVPITDIWEDTGISKPTHIDEKIQTIRKGQLSPLAIKRQPTKIHKKQTPLKVYQTIAERDVQLQSILKRETRLLALAASEIDILTNTDLEKHLLTNRATCLNIPSRSLAEAAEKRFRAHKLPSIARWRSKYYRWEQAEDIQVDVRMKKPFQHGNVCEDPVRCRTIEAKGGHSRETICPQCPVYSQCQEMGHLSQPTTLQNAKTQISPIGKLFIDPKHTHLVQQTLGDTNNVERLCIIDERRTAIDHLFVECKISKNVVEEWCVNWHGNALGNFAVALLNVFESHNQSNSNPIGQVRAVIDAFQYQEKEITQQMCYINIHGTVVERKITDNKTGTELSHYALVFRSGKTAHIPLNTSAEDRLTEMSLHTITLKTFAPNEDISIPMRLTDALAFGIFDIQTVEKIEAIPTVCLHPDWTYWHQLKRFFAHYPRDIDAPMKCYDEHLLFWMPPKLHPNVKRLLLITTSLSKRQLQRTFPDEEMEVISVEPTAWMPGNKVFQLRTKNKSFGSIVNADSNMGTRELSKLGEHYFFGIRKEIDRDINIKHAIITNLSIRKKIADLSSKPNVCFVRYFKRMDATNIANIEAVDVLWVVGTPYFNQHSIWQEAQMLFGSDETPLNYEGDIWIGKYKDERLQEVFDQNVIGVLTKVIGSIGLHHNTGKKVVLLTDFVLPDIIDRPETMFFDWEDFEIAGGLDKLQETISTRERFEAERENLTADSSREEVERVLGCSSRQANRVLNKLRGGNIPRVSIREQILFLLSSGPEKTTASLVAAIDNSPQAIGNELKRLLNAGEIVRVRRGVYALTQHKR